MRQASVLRRLRKPTSSSFNGASQTPMPETLAPSSTSVATVCTVRQPPSSTLPSPLPPSLTSSIQPAKCAHYYRVLPFLFCMRVSARCVSFSFVSQPSPLVCLCSQNSYTPNSPLSLSLSLSRFRLCFLLSHAPTHHSVCMCSEYCWHPCDAGTTGCARSVLCTTKSWYQRCTWCIGTSVVPGALVPASYLVHWYQRRTWCIGTSVVPGALVPASYPVHWYQRCTRCISVVVVRVHWHRCGTKCIGTEMVPRVLVPVCIIPSLLFTIGGCDLYCNILGDLYRS